MIWPRVIAIGSKKGGVAKTTTCLSLGASFAGEGKNVLLIDLDPEAHLSVSLGLNPERVRRTIGDALLSGLSLASVVCETRVPQLELIPANLSLDALDKLLYGRPDYELYLKSWLEAAKGDYDLILVDSPPSSSTLTINALTAANLLIIPTQCEYYASRSLHNVLKLVRQVRQKTNPTLAYRVLVTMFDRRNRIAHFIREQLEDAFSDALFKTVIEVDTRLRESPTFGLPVTSYAPATRGARQYRALAQELMNNA